MRVSSILSCSWEVGSRVTSLFSMAWDIRRIIAYSPSLSWTIEGSSTENVYGQNVAVFWGRHTGQAGSPQVIRLRNIDDPDKIVWESAAETYTKGNVAIYVEADTPEKFERIKVRQTLLSDMDTFNQKWLVIRNPSYLRIADFPVYVTQEYASTTDYRYMIRYLGYIGQNPTQYQNDAVQSVDIDEMAKQYGIALSQANQTGNPLNIYMTMLDGTKITGILPPKAAIAIVRLGQHQRAYGYIKKEGLLMMPQPGVIPPVQHYLQYFIPF